MKSYLMAMFKNLSVCFSIVIFSVTISCNRPSKKLPETHIYQLTKKYADEQNNFQIQLPENWEILPNFNGSLLTTAGPFIPDSKTQMTRDGGFALTIVELTLEHSTEVFYKGNIGPIKEEYKDFKIIEEADIDISGIPAKYICHSVTVNSVPATNIQIYFCKGKKGYILNGSAVTEDFPTYRDLYIEIARTFTITKK